MARRKAKVADMDEVNADLTPMIDIVFNLLIFFIVGTKFRSTEGMIKAFLPKNRGQGSGTPTIDLNEVRIKLLWWDASGRPTKGDGGFVVLKVGDQIFNQPQAFESISVPEKHETWQALYTKLNEFKAGYKGTSEQGLPVIIDARKEVPTRYVVLVLNEVVRAGIQDVTFAAPEIEY